MALSNLLPRALIVPMCKWEWDCLIKDYYQKLNFTLVKIKAYSYLNFDSSLHMMLPFNFFTIFIDQMLLRKKLYNLVFPSL